MMGDEADALWEWDMSEAGYNFEPVLKYDHPAARRQDKPTDKQWELLDRVCRTNGGGCHEADHPAASIKGLMDRHLIQGKAGHAGRFVHTRLGWDYWKANR